MWGSIDDERIDAGGVDPQRVARREPIRLRVGDPLYELNAHWAGVVERRFGRSAHTPGTVKPFWIAGGMMALLIATGGIAAWQAYAEPRIERAIANLGERLAHAVQVDCNGRNRNRFAEDPPTCR